MDAGTHLATYEATVLQVERNRLLSWSGQVLSPGVYDATYTLFDFGKKHPTLSTYDVRAVAHV